MGSSVFHKGELLVHSRLGVQGIEQWAAKVIRSYLPAEHRDFHTSLPFLVAAARDELGRPWATLLTGPPGFVRSPTDRTLEIDAQRVVGDALETALGQGADLGLLGIEFATRRRNRVNGRVAQAQGGGSEPGKLSLTFCVDQSFGNCPQYVRPRQWRQVTATPGPVVRGPSMSTAQQAWVKRSDTMFIASGHRGVGDDAAFGMDASHRGGGLGFVNVQSPTRLVVPDYAGNNYYNTIGNLILDPRAGLLFVDFRTGSMLQLTGKATLDWDSKALQEHPGAQRLVVFDVDAVVELPFVLPLRWDQRAVTSQTVTVAKKVVESPDVTSFYLTCADCDPRAEALAGFEAGQHIAIAAGLPGVSEAATRMYSLSGRQEAQHYRISVKRESRGLISQVLHGAQVGDTLRVGVPMGDFVLAGRGTAVLISAGIGVTPMLSMLGALVGTPERRVVWVHGARAQAHHAFASEVRQLAAEQGNTVVHVAYSQPGAGDVQHDSVGRVDGELVARLVANAGTDADTDTDYFLCGPAGFMANVQADLELRGVAPSRIHSESFG